MNAVIIGGGQVGSYVANILREDGCHIRVIERRPAVLKKLRTELPEEVLLVGDGTDPAVLEKADIASADVLVAVTGADEINLVAATIAKFEYGVNRVIARVNHPKNEWLFTPAMGVDVRVNQANLLARLVADEIDLQNMSTLVKIHKGEESISEFKVAPNSKAIGQNLTELPLPENSILIAIQRGDEIIIPHGDTVIRGGDIVLALTRHEGTAALSCMLSGKC